MAYQIVMQESIDARALQAADGSVTIVDIRRAPDDRQIPGSLRYDGEALADAVQPPFARDATIVLYCGSGNSCSRVAGVLRARGYDARALDGGYAAWKEAGLPTEPIEAPLDLD
jgi:rhodanese-related sulfurtransferase